MATISFWVEKIIEKQPFVIDALNRGLINHAALAESLIPEIEEKLKKKVKFSAVNMAIRRFAERIENSDKVKISFNKNTNLYLKLNLIAMTVKNEKGISAQLKTLYNRICSDRGDFLTTTQGLREIMIVTNSAHEEDLKDIFGEAKIIKKINNLSGITLDLPKNCTETSGVYYKIVRELAWNNISLIDFISTFEELTIIVKDEDAILAFDLIRKLIKSNI